jgi:hypothetical protein
MAVQRFRLTVVDRTIIELRRRCGCSIRMIARGLGRSSGTVCDEIKRHGKVAGYRAATAEADAAASRRRSGRKPRLAPDGPLFAGIARLLWLGWSPARENNHRAARHPHIHQHARGPQPGHGASAQLLFGRVGIGASGAPPAAWTAPCSSGSPAATGSTATRACC